VHRPIRIGITGKLGSGKSTLIRLAEARAIPVVRSDDLAKQLMESDPKLRAKLARILGPETYKNGTLDRAFVASKIFHDSALREQVEAVVHPATSEAIEKMIEKLPPGQPIVVESALILQTRFGAIFDYIILVDTPDDVALKRVLENRQMSEADAKARLAEQAYDPKLRDEADFVIENTGTEKEFRERGERLFDLLEALYTRDLPSDPLHSIEAE